ncbi:MAG: glycosyltransferase family 2 protein [Cetobacterium sp.]
MTNDLISIVTPLYNSERFIVETIESVLNQTYENWEMLIVDDCSTDSGPNIVTEYAKKDSRIIYYKMEKNSGAAHCRNKAIELSKGEYIAFLDSDDLWKVNKLENQINFMKQNDYAITFHEYEQIDEDSNRLKIKIKTPKNPVTYRKYLLTNPIGCLSGMYSVKKMGKVYMPILRKRQDTGFWLKILSTGEKAYPLEENLGLYRIRKNSLSFKKSDLIKYHWSLYRSHQKLSVIESLFYLSTTILTKIFKVKEINID